jgi:ketose-bisphosphate aldolase
VDLVKSFAARSPAPVVLHLDHGRDEQVVARALELGFRSVMFDGSACDFDENARRTAEVAKLAHARSATIEGELGRLGSEQGPGDQSAALTDPVQAGQFVRRTGVDLLAPAVGNAHGFYKSPPKLRFDLIERIAAEARVPLSLHGGTGLPLGDVRRAAELGVAKLNVASQLHRDFSEAIRASVAGRDGPPPGWWKVLQAGRDAIRQSVGGYLRGLGVEHLV